MSNTQSYMNPAVITTGFKSQPYSPHSLSTCPSCSTPSTPNYSPAPQSHLCISPSRQITSSSLTYAPALTFSYPPFHPVNPPCLASKPALSLPILSTQSNLLQTKPQQNTLVLRAFCGCGETITHVRDSPAEMESQKVYQMREDITTVDWPCRFDPKHFILSQWDLYGEMMKQVWLPPETKFDMRFYKKKDELYRFDSN